MDNIRHSSATPEWGTSHDILGPVRAVLGRIEFDPASSVAFNEIVGADAFLTKEDDALTASWPAGKAVLLNPPGGKKRGRSLPGLFWQRLMQERSARRLGHAIWVGFSLEQLAATQSKHYRNAEPPMACFPMCIPRRRLRFLSEDGTPGKKPSHSNVIVYVPGSVDRTARFLASFAALGACVPGAISHRLSEAA